MMKKLVALTVLAAFLVTCSPLKADLIQQLKELEQAYSQTEDELLQREVDHDGLLVARLEFDGVGGFFKKLLFKRKKYKNLKASLEESESGIDSTYSRMVSTWKAIQKQLFEIGHAYEQSGDYATAIQYYKQVKPRTARERFRIGVCYKLAGDYNLAISWFRKLDTNKDEVKFEIAECYKLWGKHREALENYLGVLYHYSNTELEQRTLIIVEEYDYAGKDTDFPQLYRKLGAVYKRKAFILYNNDFSLAITSYKKAMDYLARDHGGDPAKASRHILQDATQALTTAERILEEQRDAAEEYYMRKLDDALNHYEYKKREYERAIYNAERDFDSSLQRARHNRQRYLRDAQRYEQQGLREQAEQARRQAEHYERRISYLILNRQTIIEDDVDYERRAMDRAYRDYQQVRNSRRQIIDNYMAPYRRKVEQARNHLDMINNFHRTAYEDY